MSTIIGLGDYQKQRIYEENKKKIQDIEGAAETVAVPKEKFVYFAAFDGTNNDMDDLGGEFQCTNVGQLWTQFRVGAGESAFGGYYPGLGTRGKTTKETWFGPAVTNGVIKTAIKAYKDFARQATNWHADHPGEPVSVVVTGFSRGVASAAIFSQLLYKHGLASRPSSDREGMILRSSPKNVLIPPGEVEVLAGVLFDPVATGFKGNLAFPPNVKNLVSIKALQEYRHLFLAMNYTKQSDIVTTIGMYGNHCDIGGGYDNGLAAMSLEAATRFLKASGLTISDVSNKRLCADTENAWENIVVHSEQYEEQFDPYDEKQSEQWSVYEKYEGKIDQDLRLFDDDVMIAPAVPSIVTGNREFTLYDSTTV